MLIHSRMSIHRLLRLSQQRSFVSSLFGFTFIATCLTVSASNILPCPVRPERGRFADSDKEGLPMKGGQVKVVKRPRRWIEEKVPE
jgi:cytochrome c oxidase assembly factor 2